MIEKTNVLTNDGFIQAEAMTLAKQGVSIAVDFDSTLVLTDGYPNIISVNGGCFTILKKWQDMGCKIILHTMRTGKDLEKAVVWCSNCGFFFDSVNCNPEVEDIERNKNKMYAMFYVDDKALGTPLLHDTTGRYRDHVDWATIDKLYTPFLKELIEKISNNEE